MISQIQPERDRAVAENEAMKADLVRHQAELDQDKAEFMRCKAELEALSTHSATDWKDPSRLEVAMREVGAFEALQKEAMELGI